MNTGIRLIMRLLGQVPETEQETMTFPESMAGKGNEAGIRSGTENHFLSGQ